MIISISRRTDIPAFYMEWFLNRLDDGFVYVRNPFNYSQISEVSLRPDDVECFVFWTKNPKAIYDNLDALEAYSFYVQVTINPYDMTVEGNIPA